MSKVDRLSARVVLIVVVTLFFGPFLLIDFVFPDELYWENSFFVDTTIAFVSYLVVLFVILFIINSNRFFIGAWPGQLPDCCTTWFYLGLSLPMIGIAILCIFIIYWPISFVAPLFVETWLLQDIPIIVFKLSWKDVSGSILNVLTTVLIAPVTEEVVFRWLLIERWKSKYSTWVAIVLSSVIFAVLHADLLGSFVFGVLLSLVYLYTGSLWGPILIHVGNNALVSLVVILDELWWQMPATLVEFQSDWLTPLIGLMLVFPWLPIAIRRRHLIKGILHMPTVHTGAVSKVGG